jgi:tetratricopeptide (TPR) repeat protein
MQAAAITSFLTRRSSSVALADSESVVTNNDLLGHIVASHLIQIVGSRDLFLKLTDSLIQFAEQAYVMRDLSALEEVSQILLNLPVGAARHVGVYYHALAINRKGQRDEAETLLQTVADSAPISYRARAIQTLGANNLDRGQFDETLRFQHEALRVASDRNAHGLQTMLKAHFEIAIVRSLTGDHNGALSHFKNLWPLVNNIARQNPFYFYLYHNAVAVELGEAGRVEEAQAASKVALASPFAPAYPEWSATREEIAAKRQPATPSVVAINRAPEAEPSPQAEPQLKPYKSRSRLCAWLGTENSFLQRPSIAITLIATIDVAQITPGILDRVLVCIRSRAPPAHR